MEKLKGTGTDGSKYRSVEDLWAKADPGDRWYSKARDYWATQSEDDQGMLGGYASISPTDVAGSLTFLARAFPALAEAFRAKAVRTQDGAVVQGGTPALPLGRAIDCGAGIGRTTRNLLHPICETVDLVEQSAAFLETARTSNLAGLPRVRNYYCSGLQDHGFEGGPYDLIFVQWVLLYLTDADLEAFIRRALAALRPGGRVMVKENVIKDASSFVVDNGDNSITRNHVQYMAIFERAGATVEVSKSNIEGNQDYISNASLFIHPFPLFRMQYHDQQQGFPKELFPVMMYMLKP